MAKDFKIGAAIPVCEADREYLPMCFDEIERMDVHVAWMANNCSSETLKKLRDFPRTINVSEKDGYYNNCMRNLPMEQLVKFKYDWMLQWDVDETWEPDAPRKLGEILNPETQMYQVRMGHVWMKDNEPYITTDFSAERDRIYNLKHHWLYLAKVVAGPTDMDEGNHPTSVDLWMIHWGYSTQNKRLAHKKRWDTNHGRSTGKNPYNHWYTITRPDYEPKLTPYNKFLSELRK